MRVPVDVADDLEQPLEHISRPSRQPNHVYVAQPAAYPGSPASEDPMVEESQHLSGSHDRFVSHVADGAVGTQTEAPSDMHAEHAAGRSRLDKATHSGAARSRIAGPLNRSGVIRGTSAVRGRRARPRVAHGRFSTTQSTAQPSRVRSRSANAPTASSVAKRREPVPTVQMLRRGEGVAAGARPMLAAHGTARQY